MASWESVESDLAGTLAGLAADEFVIVGDPEPPVPPRTGLLRRRPEPPPVRYVQYRCDDGTDLYAECVGATLFGGDWEIAADVHERLRALGWLAPGDPDPTGTQPAYPNYWQCLPRDRAATLARAGAEALRLLGCEPAALDWRRGVS